MDSLETQQATAAESNVRILNVTIITPSKVTMKDFGNSPKDCADNEVSSTKYAPSFIEGINELKNHIDRNSDNESYVPEIENNSSPSSIINSDKISNNLLTLKDSQKSSVKTRKRLTLISDSDSDSEHADHTTSDETEKIKISESRHNFSGDENSKNEEGNHFNLIIKDSQKSLARTRKRLTLISDSDSDSEHAGHTPDKTGKIKTSEQRLNFSEDGNSKSEGENNFNNSKNIRPKAVFDSDSEPEIEPHEKSYFEDKTRTTEEPVYEVNSKGELVPENHLTKNIKKSTFSNLFDSESSDDETKNTGSDKDPVDSDTEETVKPIVYKKKSARKKDVPEDKPKKMTGKEAAELRKEIKSESQRMLRESSISLPYHKPKSHSLKEFLSRRPKLACAVPASSKLPASVAIKMSTEQLKIVSQKIKEREKELKEFYKSESEPESDDDKDYVPPGETNDNNSDIQNIGTSESKDEETKINFHSTEKLDDTQKLQDLEIKNNNTNLMEELAMEIDEIDEPHMEIKEYTEDKQKIVEEDSNNPEVTAQNSISSEDFNVPDNLENENISTSVSNKILGEEIHPQIDTTRLIEQNDQITLETKNIEEETKSQDPMIYDFNLDDIEENTERYLPEKLNSCTEENTELNEKSIDDTVKFTELAEDLLNGDIIKDSVTTDELNSLEVPLSDNVKQATRFEFTDLDKEIENFGQQPTTIIEAEPVKKLSKLELIKERLANTKPRLSGGPDEIIDLDAGVTKPNEVTKLMKRFMSHANVKKHTQKSKVKLNIVTVESGGDIHNETVAMNIEEDEVKVVVDEKPGEKLKKLREELEKQMIEEKSKIWQQKASKGIGSNENKDEDIEYADDFDDILDDEDEAEMTDNEESEEELVENDVDLSEKPTEKSDFVDDEAEESDNEECNDFEEKEKLSENEEDKDNIIEMDKDEKENNSGDEAEAENDTDDSSSEDDNGDNDEQKENTTSAKKKSLKRIVKAFEDSDDEDDMFNRESSFVTPNKSNITTHLDTTETAEEDDMFIPPHQLPFNKTPIRQVTPTRSHFDISTPLSLSLMSGLQSIGSAQKGSPIISETETLPSPSKESSSSLPGFQKKLFYDPPDTFSTQDEDMQQLAEICSGQFPTTQEVTNSGNLQSIPADEEATEEKSAGSDDKEETPEVPPSTQDLLNVCSGGFTGMTGVSKNLTDEDRDKVDVQKGDGNNQMPMNQIGEVKGLDDGEDLIISQLLDEEELENFKRKFDSPLVKPTQKMATINEDAEEIQGGGRIDSDDDNDELLAVKKKKKKKNRNQRKIVFSDDDSSDDEQQNEAEEKIDLYDSCHEDEENLSIENIGYDSEENEIDINVPGPREKLRPADFFEAEAELSESEWGSADEDEKDLDKLEFELGDTEKFDEEKVREDIEKIHMKRMLDDDTREVKLLQELLLEDGELHGTGRQRQFKWKNIDSVDDENGDTNEIEDEIYMDEEESEEQWRKRRHEREMFLKEKIKSISSNDSQDSTGQVSSNSQILKLGQKVLQRSQNNSQSNTPVGGKIICPDGPKDPVLNNNPLALLNKRGSFLSRGEQVLQRLAEYTKVTTILGTATAKNSKNFLFQTVSSTKTISLQNKKRKADEGTPNMIKKLRLSSSDLSPANKKQLDKPERAKKLFGNV